MLNLSQLARINNFFQLHDHRGINKGMSHHEGQILLPGNPNELLTLYRGVSHWLFDKSMFAGLKALPGHLEMKLDGRGDDDGANVGIIDDIVEIRRGLYVAVKLLHVLQALNVRITNKLDSRSL
jgi:hypothetical protein